MFSEMAKVRHDTAVAKINDVCGHVENMFEEGIDKVVVFAHHRDVVNKIHEHFGNKGISSVILYGGMSDEESQKSIDEFQDNPDVKLFIGNIKAAGVGITLTSSHNVVFAELDWTPANMSQAEDRCHRIGQNDSVLIQHLVLENSFDAKMAQSLVDKQNIIDGILDDEIDMSVSDKQPTTLKLTINESVIGKPLKKENVVYTNETKQQLLKGLKIIASVCDGALAEDNMGFNKFDSHIGKALSELSDLSEKQSAVAYRLVVKYQRQLPDELVDSVKEAVKKNKDKQ